MHYVPVRNHRLQLLVCHFAHRDFLEKLTTEEDHTEDEAALDEELEKVTYLTLFPLCQSLLRRAV